MLSVSSILGIAARAIESQDECKQIERINQARELMYSLYPEVDVAPVRELCIEMSCFPRCGECDESYRGFSLPRGMANVESLSVNDRWNSSHAKSSWRHYGPCDGVCMQEHRRMHGQFALEREPMDAAQLVISANRMKESGIVSIRGADYDITGEPLMTDSVYSFPLMAGDIRIGEGLTHGVQISTEDGQVLSRTGCNESIPAYTRYLVFQGPCEDSCGGLAIVVGTSSFEPVTHPDDPIEGNSTLVYEYLLKAVEIMKKSNLIGEELNSYRSYIEMAREIIQGMALRETGHASNVRLKFERRAQRRSIHPVHGYHRMRRM